MNETLQIILSEYGKNHMKPFSNLIIHENNFFGTSNDGRLFQINPQNYEILASYELHNSWISSIDVSDNYLLTSSYDGYVSLFLTNEIIKNHNSKFIKQNLHNDYILSCSLIKNNIITASSEPSLLISTINSSKSNEIQQIHTFQNLSCSCHSLCSDANNSIVYCGFSDGSLYGIDIREKNFSFQQKKFQSSCIKAIHYNNDNTLCIGDLDGSVSILDTRNFQEISKNHGESRVISIQKQKDKGYFVYFADGSFLDTNKNSISKLINSNISSCVRENENIFHICDEKGILHRIENSKETCKIEPSISCKKMVRLQHSTDILMKYSDKSVALMDGTNFQIKENFGKVDFNEKLKDLLQKPSLYFPISFDVTNGIPKIIISNFLPKIVHPSYVNERKYLHNFVQALIDKKLKVVCINTFNIPLWTSRSDEKLPNWMKSALDPRLPYP